MHARALVAARAPAGLLNCPASRPRGAAGAEGGKPDPDILQVALERAGAAPDHALMVGDSVWDVEASRKAGVACIGVESGGTSAHELREAGAVAVYDGPRALLDVLRDSPIGERARRG